MRLRERLKRSVWGDAWIRRLPPFYGRYRRLLARMEEAGADERGALSARLTERTLAWAAQTEYARARGLAGPLERWPLLEKAAIRDHGAQMTRRVAAPVASAETGGTTGVPLALARGWRSVVFEQAVLDHIAMRHAGVDWAGARVAALRGDDVKPPSDMTPPFWRRQQGGRELRMSSQHLRAGTAGLYFEALRNFRPELLWVYPSVLESLCKLAGDDLALAGLRLVASSSEVLDAETHALARRRLRAPVLDYYGQAERCAFAYSLDGRNHWFLPAYGRIELIPAYEDEGDAYYEIVATSYWNDAQPLARLATGDLARLPAGATAREIEEVTLGLRPFRGVAGRRDEYLAAPGGARLVAINQIPRGVPDVVQMQFMQTSPGRLEIHVVPQPGFSEETRRLILAKARTKIPDTLAIEIVLVDQPRRTARGKAPLVIRAPSL